MDVTNPIKEYIRIFYQNFKPIGGQIKVIIKTNNLIIKSMLKH